MFSEDFYWQLVQDVARATADKLESQIREAMKEYQSLPLTMTISEASKRSGMSKAAIRGLKAAGIITGTQTGTSENSPILIHTDSLLVYLQIKNKEENIVQIIKRIAA